MSQKDLRFKYGKSEDLPTEITPGAVYFTRNDITGQGEIFYDLPDDTLEDGDKKRLSVIGGGIYVGEEEFPENYNIKINPSGLSTIEAHCEEDDSGNKIYVGGVMSAEDKRRLDHLWKYLGNINIQISNEEPSESFSPEVDTVTIVISE